MSNISINELSDAINDVLSNYSEEVTEKTKKAVDRAAKDCMDTIKQHIEFKQHTGDYVKSFKLKTAYEDKYNKRKTWYASGDQYRLTHLLEKGHALRRGGRTRAYPHIQYGEEIAKQNLPKYIKEELG